MVRRATGSAEKLTAGKAGGADDMSGGDASMRAIALKLGPLLAPYKKQGRFLVRIERMPQLGRLSSGRNNGDGSWSLSLDELDDLTYLYPETITEAHTLAIRVIGLEGVAGSTLAVLNFVVSPHGEAGVERDGAAGTNANTEILDAQIRRLREELAKAKTALAVRESELAELRREPGADDADVAQQIEAALSLARGVWKAEMNDRLAAAASEAAIDIERRRASWEAENASPSGLSESDVRKQLTEARERFQREKRDALAKAEKAWKTEEAERLAAAEAEWREEAKAASPDKRAASDIARAERDAKELRALREKLTALEGTLFERETALADAENAAEELRATSLRENEDRLRKAELEWKAKESKRFATARAEWQEEAARTAAKTLAAARAEWQEESARAAARALAAARAEWQEDSSRTMSRALDEATARYEEAEAALAAQRADADGAVASLRRQEQETIRRLKQERDTAATKLAQRESELKELRLTSEKARIDWQHDSQATFDKAKAEWAADEAERLLAAETRWRDDTARKLTDVNARCEKLEAALRDARVRGEADIAAARQSDADELRRLRDERIALGETLAERDRELAQLRPATEKARMDLQSEMQAALAKARIEWKAEEKTRFAALEAQRKSQMAEALTNATTRYQIAEATLAHIRKESQSMRENEHGDVQRLHEKIAHLQAALGEHEEEVRAHQMQGSAANEKIVLRSNREWQQAEAGKYGRSRSVGRIARDVALVGALAASVAIFYPQVAPYLPRTWQAQISTWTENASFYLGAPRRPEGLVGLELFSGVRTMAIVVEDVNVRAGPSTATAVISHLERGRRVATGERQGNWRRVELEAATGTEAARSGWVYDTFLSVAAEDGSAMLTVQNQ